MRKPSPQPSTPSDLIRQRIVEGRATDAEIWNEVKTRFGLSDDKRAYITWHRANLKKLGVEISAPPRATEDRCKSTKQHTNKKAKQPRSTTSKLDTSNRS